MDYHALKVKVPPRLKAVTTFQTAGCKPLGKLALGFGLAETVGQESDKLGRGSALLVTDKVITELGMHEVVVDSLQKAGFQTQIFDDVEAEPHIETAQKLEAIVRSQAFAVIVGLGGGSPLDMAKTASLVGNNPQPILDLMQGETIENEGLPLILLPTTSGTGSEVSPFVVTSTAEKKLFIITPQVYPNVALVDPLLTASMPGKVTAGTGLDALSHGVEGLVGCSNPLTQALAGKCVELVFRYLPAAVRDGDDLTARYHMSFASVMGMMTYTQGGGLYAHSCSYILTLDKNLPHGLGCGITLPYTLMFNLDYLEEMLSDFAPQIDPSIAGSGPEKARQVVARFHDLVAAVGLPVSLKDIGVSLEDLEDYAQKLVKQYYRVKNPRKLEIGDARALLKSMWEGELRRI